MAPTDDEMATATQIKRVTRAQDADAPAQSTLPRAKTPPPVIEKRRLDRNTDSGRGSERSVGQAGSAVDPGQLNKALQRELEEPRSRDITPGGSPVRKRQRIYGDR